MNEYEYDDDHIPSIQELDDEYSGNSEAIKENALFNELYRYLDQALSLNVEQMLDAAITATRITMTSQERRRFYDKHIRNMSLVIHENGDVSIELRKK